MTKIERYPSQVFWSEEDGGFIALAPDLPGCSAFGETKGEALAELDHAVEAWIGAAEAAGNPVPEPSKLPTPSSYSGKILLRLPKELHAKLAQSAKLQDVSLNQYLLYVITTGEAHVSHVNLGSTGVAVSNLRERGHFRVFTAPIGVSSGTDKLWGVLSDATHGPAVPNLYWHSVIVTPSSVQSTARMQVLVDKWEPDRAIRITDSDVKLFPALQSQTGNG
ncbi:MAG: toxin-antitoxin system HicB family antitoxin [Methylocystis sp.]